MLFKEKLKSHSINMLVGGDGCVIAQVGGEMSPALSALVSITSPEIVIKVHEKFIDAGCDLITANTFSSTRHNLESINRGAEVKEFITQSLKLSRQAIKNKGKENRVGIAGSLSNFFSLKENEFVPNPKYIPSFQQEEQNYKEAAKILKEEGVDILILEMFLDIDHSTILLNAPLEPDLPVWVGLSCCISKFDNSVIGRNFIADKEISLIFDETKYKEPPNFLPDDKILVLNDIVKSLTNMGGDVYGVMHTWFVDAFEGLSVIKNNWNGPMLFSPEIHKFDTKSHKATSQKEEEEFSNETKS
jgi:Methionine synthase I (cobalamin-dependent), methyltransferase domain